MAKKGKTKYGVQEQERKIAPEGIHNARIVRIAEMGTQVTDFGDKFKVQISYELVDESAVFNEEKGEQNYVIHKTYNRSLHKRSDLAKDIKGATGLTFEPGDEFEMDDLLDQPCQVEVTHSDGETVYANITNVVAAPKGAKIAKAESDLKSLYLDENFDEDVFDSLPEGLKEKIMKSDEYKEIAGESKPAKKGAGKSSKKASDEDEDEDEEEDERPRKKAAPSKQQKKPVKKTGRR